MKGLAMRIRMVCAVLIVVSGCSGKSNVLDAEDLSNMLSITNLSAQPVLNQANPPLIVAVRIDADVVHVGEVPIDVPFILTWRLTDDQNATVGQASKQFDGNMEPGAVRHVTLTVEFEARESVAGLRNAATFDPASS